MGSQSYNVLLLVIMINSQPIKYKSLFIMQEMPKQYGAIRYFLLWALLLCAISMASSSSGDRSETFQRCLTSCLVLCKNDDSYPAKLPVYLVIFGWRCADECKYTCMHKVTHHALARGWKIEQFYGKVNITKIRL